jgi:regulator of protease activity HflC (stomatin/prohibitin superfamily)
MVPSNGNRLKEGIKMFDRERSATQDYEDKRMKNTIKLAGSGILGLIVLCFGWFSWNSHNISPGTVGVFYDKPFFFGHGGVREEVTLPGRVITWRSTDVLTVSTAPWTIKVHVDDMMSSNKVPLDFDIAITLQMTSPQNGPQLIKEFNGGAVEAFGRVAMQGINMETLIAMNPSGEFMSFLRDRVREKHMDEFIAAHDAKGGHSDASSDIEKALVKYMNEFLKLKNVPVTVTNVALGRANPPDNVKASMERTAEQVQMQTTERERAEAQRERKAAEEASAEADKAQQLKLGFNNAEYLKKLELETILKICGSNTKDMKDSATGARANCTIVYGQALPMISSK